MIRRGTYQPHAFLTAIATAIGGSDHARIDPMDYAPMAEEQRRLIYLAGGYWRAVASWTETGDLVGVSLRNPDHSVAECEAVERGIAILRRLEYVVGHVDVLYPA